MNNTISYEDSLKCLDQLPCALLDETGNYQYVSSKWVKIMGISAEKALKSNVLKLIPDTHANIVISTKKVVYSKPIIKNGIPLFTTYIPLLGKNNKLEGIFLYITIDGMPNVKDLLIQIEKTKLKIKYYRDELSKERGAKYNLSNIIGESPAIKQLKEQIQRAARSASTVLIEGETGTGKELIAQSIHSLSDRRENNLVKVNCSAIPSELMESEFFGYSEGAFTGASRKGKIGRFELANHGTLFLDEINLLPITMQPKFLRVIQEKEVDPIGGSKTIPVDTRIIAASNVSLEKLIQKGDFRIDLYYRLNVIHIKSPALRTHLEDLPILANNLLQRLNRELGMMIKGISPQALALLGNYEWPGNVRELQNAIESAMNMTTSSILQKEDFYPIERRIRERKQKTYSAKNSFSLKDSLSSFEEEVIKDALKSAKGNRVHAARKLGISRTSLYKKIKQYNLE